MIGLYLLSTSLLDVMKVIKFGMQLADDEAKKIISALNKQLKK